MGVEIRRRGKHDLRPNWCRTCFAPSFAASAAWSRCIAASLAVAAPAGANIAAKDLRFPAGAIELAARGLGSAIRSAPFHNAFIRLFGRSATCVRRLADSACAWFDIARAFDAGSWSIAGNVQVDRRRSRSRVHPRERATRKRSQGADAEDRRSPDASCHGLAFSFRQEKDHQG